VDWLTPDLTEQLTVLSNVPVSNGAGGWTDAWATVATVRGRVSAMKVTSRHLEVALEGGERRTAQLYDVILDARGLPEPSNTWRIRDAANRDYEIVTGSRQTPYFITICREVI